MAGALTVIGWFLNYVAVMIIRKRLARPRTNGDGTPCGACGYRRTGLAPSAVCPECGSSTERGLARAMDNDRRWQWRLAAAAFVITLGVFAIGVGTMHWRFNGYVSVARVIVACVLLAPGAVIGALHLTAHDEREVSLGRASMLCLAACVTLGLLAGSLWCAWGALSASHDWARMQLIFVSLAALAGAGIGAFQAAACLWLIKAASADEGRI